MLHLTDDQVDWLADWIPDPQTSPRLHAYPAQAGFCCCSPIQVPDFLLKERCVFMVL
jgi:hypothetical protein